MIMIDVFVAVELRPFDLEEIRSTGYILLYEKVLTTTKRDRSDSK